MYTSKKNVMARVTNNVERRYDKQEGTSKKTKLFCDLLNEAGTYKKQYFLILKYQCSLCEHIKVPITF